MDTQNTLLPRESFAARLRLQKIVSTIAGAIISYGTFSLLCVVLLFGATPVQADTITTLASFGPPTGHTPDSILLGSDGNLYGTTLDSANNAGTVFKLTPTGALTVLASLSNDSGSSPRSLVQGNDGSLYGTAFRGPGLGFGTIFKVTLSGTLTPLVNLNGTNGDGPQGLIQGRNGNFYGVTEMGGANDLGAVFQMTPAGILTTLASLDLPGGTSPLGGVIEGADGNFYGTTLFNAQNGAGTVFRMTPSGVLTTLAMLDGTHGRFPTGSLVQDRDGNLYGVAAQGGAHNAGAVFRVTLQGTLTTLAELDGTNGSQPMALIQGRSGDLFGAASTGGPNNLGSIFRVNPNGGLTTLISFDGSNGGFPRALALDGNGNVVGVTGQGGVHNAGTIFRLNTDSELGAVALQGDPAPGLTGATFTSFGPPAMNSDGRVAFLARASGPGLSGANSQGIWADDASGALQLVIRGSDPAPGTNGAVFSMLSDPVYNLNEAVAFVGSLRTNVGDVTRANCVGVWSNDQGVLKLIARKGDPAPGCSGAVFDSFLQIALPDQGGVVMQAALKVDSSVVTSTNRQGIWAVDSTGALKLILRQGDLHPATGKVVASFAFLQPHGVTAGQTRAFSPSTGALIYRVTFSDRTSGIFTVRFP